ncbi:MAG: ribosome biogenesis GTPase Der [Flavobacteriales bacterium]|nr:ribosome biogenesis GTPase Der [Flavobacteriales bacterium]NNK81452.1 ribosome biogenesis GTPase Der [Flavobacteriales bacterium]
MSNIVAIIGRPNVGKSTFFNRLTGQRAAIVDEQSGVTRDRHYGKSEWNGVEFSVIDTGGYVEGSDDVFEEQINRQVKLAIDEADVLIFLTDVETGITDLDEGVANLLRQNDKPHIVVVNKVDNHARRTDAMEFYSLGLGEYYPISAINGSGTGDMLDALVDKLDREVEVEDSDLPRIAVVGKPNVGKSSFTNAILGDERNIVTDVAGTTRDALDTHYNAFGMEFIIVDTAGIRKKKKVHEDVEFYSVLRSIRAIEQSDVCILMIDANEGLQKQDLNIYYVIERNKKGIVILVNKWDTIEKDESTTRSMEKEIRERLEPFTDVPIIFTSALTKQRIHKALESALVVYNNRSQKIPTSTLNEVLLPILDRTPPPSLKGKYVKIKYISQLPTRVPSFAFFCNLPQYIKEPYKRFIENQMRKHFDLTGVPINIFFRKK